MKVTDVQIRTVEDKVRTPVTNALGKSPRDFSHVWRTHIVEVHTDEGITGTLATDSFNDCLKQLCLNHLKPVIVGEDPLNYERVWRRMFGEVNGWRHPVAGGEVIRAISALDTAIWDLIGKRYDTPLCTLLGGYRDTVPCYASGGHYVTLDSQSEELTSLEAETSTFMKMGFKAVKMRVGRDLATDIERTRLVRRLIGPEGDLMFDFNFSQTYRGGVARAIRFMKALEEFDPYWFEDPLVMDDVAGMKQIADAVDTAIATGEREQTLWGFRELIVNRAVDILLPDAAQVCGGVTAWRRIAAMADAFRIPVAAHVAERTHVHCVASAPNGLMVEVFRPLENRRRMYEVAPIMPNKDGVLEVPQNPGLGLELNEDYIEKHLVR